MPPATLLRALAVAGVGVALCAGAACISTRPVVVQGLPGIIAERADHGEAARLATAGTRSSSRAAGFWEAVADFDFDAATRHAVTRYLQGDATGEEQRRLVEALRFAVAGHASQADSALIETLRAAEDSTVRRVARLALTAILQYDGDWPKLAALAKPSPSLAAEPVPALPPPLASIYAARDDSSVLLLDDVIAGAPRAAAAGDSGVRHPTPELVKASVEAWAAVFRNVPRARYTFPAAPVTLPLSRSASGIPAVPVRVNGRNFVFWLDTGSSLTILSSTVAAVAGVAPLGRDTLEAVTATGRVSARPALAARLELGGLRIDDASAMIVDARDLSLTRGDSATIFVDGIIGFDAIRRMDLELDFKAARATIRRPAPPDSASEKARNLFWLGYPVVRMVASDGTPVHFALDTGADESYASVPLLVKTRAKTYIGERQSVAGFGKALTVRGRFIPRLRLLLRDHWVRLERVFVYVTHYPTLFALDGTLGGDVAAGGGVVRIDMTRGVFAVGRSRGAGRR